MRVGDLRVHYKCDSCGAVTKSTRFNLQLNITELGPVIGAECISCRSQKLIPIHFECDLLQTIKVHYALKCDLCGTYWIEYREVDSIHDLIAQKAEMEAASFCANFHCPSTSFSMIEYGVVR